MNSPFTVEIRPGKIDDPDGAVTIFHQGNEVACFEDLDLWTTDMVEQVVRALTEPEKYYAFLESQNASEEN